MNIIDRKQELIRRDPLGMDFDEKLQSWLKERHNVELWESIENLRKKIKEKWRVNIYIPETTIQGLTKFWSISGDPHESVRDAREGSTVFLKDDGKLEIYSFNQNQLIYCRGHEVPIVIDLSLLTLNDAKKIKTAVWNIVKKYLKSPIISEITITDDENEREGKGWNPSIPESEPKELSRIFHLRERTFKNYLGWYDMKMEGLPFRLIALIDRGVKDPEKKSQAFENQIAKRRKSKIGKRVKGESAVRNGFNTIFWAIHRTSPPEHEKDIQTLTTYNCPKHGNSCDETCPYLKQFTQKIEQAYMLRPLDKRELQRIAPLL